MDTLISIKNLNKSFEVGVQTVKIIKGINLDINEGDFAIIFGPSGCGKSTLLHTILGLEEPTTGQCLFMGKNLYLNTNEDIRSSIRKLKVGMIYQQPYWIRSLNVIENVTFPLTLLGSSKIESYKYALQLLDVVGMKDFANYITTQLSSGQQQKVAFARALINDPEIIIADEPTGNLDFESGQELMELMVKLNKGELNIPKPYNAKSSNKQKTILMVTHDLEYLKYAKTVIQMFNGEIENIYKGEEEKAKLLKQIKTKLK